MSWTSRLAALTPVGREEFSRLVMERAGTLVPPGEVLLDSHRLVPAENMPEPPRKLRPRVSPGRRRTPGDRLVRATARILAIATFNWNPIDAAYARWEERDRWKEQPFFGGWDSLAGQLVRGLCPRTNTGTVTVFLVTDRRLQLVHVQHGFFGRERPGDNAVAGWSVDRQQTAWARNRRDVKPGTFEVGFTDGSWATVLVDNDGWAKFWQAFPHQLRHTDPIP